MNLNQSHTEIHLEGLKVEPLRKEDLEQTRRLFLSWGYRDFQLQRLKIPKEKLAELLVRDLWQKNLRSICVKAGGRLIGLLSIKQFPWISNLMNTRSASSVHLLASEQDERVYRVLLNAFSRQYRDIEFMNFRTPNDNIHAVHALGDSKIFFVGNEIFLARNLNGFSAHNENLQDFIKCPQELWPQVISLAGKVHVHNRYINDPQISKGLADSIFSRYIADFGYNHDYSTIVKVKQGEVIGFIMYKLNSKLSKAVGRNYASLDFIGVHPQIRGNRIGYLLNMAALTDLARKGTDHVVVRTNGNNYPALRILYHCGFKITASDLHFHLWRSTHRPPSNSNNRVWQTGSPG